MINLFYKTKDIDKEHNTQETELLRQADFQLEVCRSDLREYYIQEQNFTAKEKWDAFNCEESQLFIAMKESRRRDNHCLIIGAKKDRSFSSLTRDLIMGKGEDHELLVVYCPVKKVSLFKCHQKFCKTSFFRGSNESSKKQSNHSGAQG